MIAQTEKNRKHPYLDRFLEMVMVLILALYPLRHIHIGLDLWDTGYSYLNFQYMGLESMDSMWLFSTYISNFIGHMMTLLPFGKTLLAMNFYTGLTVSLLAVSAYIFCTRGLKYNKFVTFIGEFMAVSLCWCPTAVLYNYLTYIFMLIAVICIYRGLVANKRRYLFIAGICLGLNVFVRFSNLPEVIFIFAVWAYGIVEFAGKFKGETANVIKHEKKLAVMRTLRRTFWCVMGYLAAVGIMLFLLNLKYGFGTYFESVSRLFSMTGTATDYSAKAMLLGILKSYIEGGYWTSRIFAFAVVGMIVCAIGKQIDKEFAIKESPLKGVFEKNFSFLRLAYLFCFVFAVLAMIWLYKREFLFIDMGGYSSIIMPGMVLALLIVITCIARIFQPGLEDSERLQAGLVLIIVMITPIGSNNGIYPVLNNMFVVAPFFINCVWKFLKVKEFPCLTRADLRRNHKDKKRIHKMYLMARSYFSPVPLKLVLVFFLIVSMIQFSYFGAKFVFTEAHGAVDCFYTMEENKNLRGIRMDFDKAYDLYCLYEYATENELIGRESIVFGYIPSVAYYLQMPPAFNAWLDLRTYSIDEMKLQVQKVCDESQGDSFPVIITSVRFGMQEQAPDKWEVIRELIEFGHYRITYSNDTYTVYEASK